MIKLKATSRLGRQLLASTGSLTNGDPFQSPKGCEDTDDEDTLNLHFIRGDYVVITDGKHAGTKGVVAWFGRVQSGGVRVGVKPLKGELVMVDSENVEKEKGKIG